MHKASKKYTSNNNAVADIRAPDVHLLNKKTALPSARIESLLKKRRTVSTLNVFHDFAIDYFQTGSDLRRDAFLSFVFCAPAPKSPLDFLVFEELTLAAFSSHIVQSLKVTHAEIRSMEQSPVTILAADMLNSELNYQEQSLMNINKNICAINI